MHHYTVYDLRLASSLVLPLCPATQHAPEVLVQLGSFERPAYEVLLDTSMFGVSAAGAFVGWEGVGDCLVCEGREIIVQPEPGCDEALLALLVLGPALTLLLQQRGDVVLHGSVVGYEDGAVAFLGASGAGKSTLAAALGTHGRHVVADDLAVIRFDAGVPYVMPGPPQLRLLPDSVRALGHEPDTLPRIHDTFVKRAWRVARGEACGALPLRQIYLLSETGEGISAPLTPREAFLEIARHHYLHAVQLLMQTKGEAQLLKSVDLANRVPVRRLRRHPPLATLGALDARIREHHHAEPRPHL
jgi:hypothetical protein